jgi:ADP-ribose pyrophosphatase YjhB (NUDIX family)
MDIRLRRRVQPRVLETGALVKIGAGAVFISKNTGRCLLQLRNNSNKRNNNTWGLWGGMVDENETPLECLHRELTEEIAEYPGILKLNPIDVFRSKDKKFIYYSFACIVEDEFIPTLNEESAGYCWVDIGKWPKPLHSEVKKTLDKSGTEKLRLILELNG